MNSSVKVNEKVINIDLVILYQRMLIRRNMSDDLSDYFKYEIAWYPLSLFTNSGMRKTIKSNLYEEFTYVDEAVLKKTDCFIIDGGYLLHAVKWNKNSSRTYADVCNSYVQYLTDQYKYRK